MGSANRATIFAFTGEDFICRLTNCEGSISSSTRRRRVYNGYVADSIKVSGDQFKAVMRALLNTPPMPASDIPRKRAPKAKKQAGYKR